MSVRKLLLFLGIAFVIAGLWLGFVWFNRVTPPAPTTAQPAPNRPALLTALHSLPAGALLREGDIGWKEITQGQARPGQLLRADVSETEFLGAITRRDFAEGEPLTASELVKPGDRRFLSAVLRPGRRAVSISVDAPQTASGLVLPGDYVDVILTQNFADNIANIAYRSAGETVLRNVRVVAVDRSLGTLAKPGVQAGVPGAEQRIPKTITLDVNEQQATKLFVATQLGKLQLAVRSIEGAGAAVLAEEGLQHAPLWASDVSRAIAEIGNRELAQREAEQREAEQKEAEQREAAQREAEQKEAERKEAASRNALPVSSGSTVKGVRYAPPYASR